MFYIGKGTSTRKHGYDRANYRVRSNRAWLSIVAKNGGKYEIEIVMHFATEQECFDKEKELIGLYRRMCDGGTLANMTLGGEGHLGLPASDELRAKRRAQASGENHPNWGKKLSAETCKKKSDAVTGEKHHLYGKKLPERWRENIAAARRLTNGMKGRTGQLHHLARRVVDSSTGKIYFGVSSAATALGMNYKTLYNCLSGHRPNRTTLQFAQILSGSNA